jgi:hypothetical protein
LTYVAQNWSEPVTFQPSHIPFSRLVDWVKKQPTPEEHNQLQQHFDLCSRCRTEAARVTHMLMLMRSDTAIDPPPAISARALRIFRNAGD